MSMGTFQIITEEAALKILYIVRDLEWHQGKARTEEATGTIKQNLELKATDDMAAKELLLGLQDSIKNSVDLKKAVLPRKTLVPKFNRYTVDSPHYQRHGDGAQMGTDLRTDLSCTIFLTPLNEYDGGVLCVENNFGGVMEVKGPPGMCVVYPGGSPHWVTPVTRGERICAVTWMQSYIRDMEKRELMASLSKVIHSMDDGKWSEEYTSLGIISGKLMRMWME